MKNQIVFFSMVLQGRICYVLYTHYFNIITGLSILQRMCKDFCFTGERYGKWLPAQGKRENKYWGTIYLNERKEGKKRAVKKTVTRSCYARNTSVTRAEHGRVTPVTRTCYALCVEKV